MKQRQEIKPKRKSPRFQSKASKLAGESNFFQGRMKSIEMQIRGLVYHPIFKYDWAVSSKLSEMAYLINEFRALAKIKYEKKIAQAKQEKQIEKILD